VERRHEEATELLDGQLAAAARRRPKICKHKLGCPQNALWLALRAGAGGYAAKATLEAAVTLLRKRSLTAAMGALARKDTARFALFLAAMVGGSAGTRCLLIYLRGRDDRLNAAISGAVGGLASLLDSPQRRQGVALYLLVRSCYALLHALMRRRYITRVPSSATALFAAANAVIIFAFISEPQLLDRSYYNWMLRTADVTGAVISYTMRETRLGLHPGAPGVLPVPPGCSSPMPGHVHPMSASPGGVDVLSGVIELASLLGAAAGVPAPSSSAAAAASHLKRALTGSPAGHSAAGAAATAEASDRVLGYSEAMNTPPDDALGPSLTEGGGVLGPRAEAAAAASRPGGGADAPLTTADGSVTVVGTGGHHYGFQTTGKAVREATGVDFMTAKGWGDAPDGGRQLRPGGGGSRAIARLYSAAEMGVQEMWGGRGGMSGAGAPPGAGPLRLTAGARERVWRAALAPDAAGRALPTGAELASRSALLRQAPPRALLPGVPCGPPFHRRCDEVFHPGQSCAVYHTAGIPALALRCARLYAPVHLVPLVLFRWRSLLQDPAGTAVRAGTAIGRSTAFLTGYVAIVKGLLCAQRTARRSDAWWQASAAGVLSGLALSFEAPKRASELMLYCLPKAVDVAFQLLERRGLVSRVPLGNVVMFSVAMAIVLALDRSDFRPAYSSLLGLLFGEDQSTFNSDPVASGAAPLRVPAAPDRPARADAQEA